ncbi:hypothetical protein J2X36_000835 [Methylobacterium sp. BE186]|uniref:hypothetical protein n=1 Tax=Methylobacterium sp. BE186 TaxID=2817715 RepID=UPI00285C183E|nr:hypothetical protein [Methylobacterium sp. BE186]MDR7036099.1 hypothetical protein [Methylobacterium sp. BE186]
MPQRILIGRHPDGACGLFISRPGVDVGGVGSADYNNLWFSTQFGQVARIHDRGTCGHGQRVYYANPGYYPLLRFEQVVNDGIVTYPNFGFPFSANGRFYRADWTRYRMDQYADGFAIFKRDPNTDSGAVSPTFRWLAYTIPVAG